mmetsp:Transcript_16506/g.49927  ORF Transcript_16506/g.49927 Transcript_16506/m.49927 type:complete len:254 (-) Transcript_16506:10-771(-)
MWHEPDARISIGSEPIKCRDMSKSWTAMSLKMPPPPLTYSNGGGEGSREHNLTTIGVPSSPVTIACLTRAKFGSKRRCRAVISLMPAFSHALIATIVSGKSVAMGFSQNTDLPLSAHRMICSAWNDDGEQIHTASTSGWSMTSSALAVHSGTLCNFAAASALDTVGFDTITHLASWQLASASKCTRPMRPAPITPTFTTRIVGGVVVDARTLVLWRSAVGRDTNADAVVTCSSASSRFIMSRRCLRGEAPLPR